MLAKLAPFVPMALLCLSASAQPLPDPALAPCIDDDTLVVIRFDTAKLHPQAVVDWMESGLRERKVEPAVIGNILKPVRSRADRSAAFLDGLHKAGAAQVYWVLSVQDFTTVNSFLQFWEASGGRGVWVVPLPPGGKDQSVIEILTRNPKQEKPAIEARRIGDAIIAAIPSRMPQRGPVNLPPLWDKAFGVASDAPLQVTVVPGTALRKSFEENLPSFPLSTGLLPITTFTQGIQYAVISISLPPSTKISGFVQSPDATSARGLANALNALTAEELRNKKLSVVSWLPPIEGSGELFQFVAAGDRVNWAPSEQSINLLQPLIMAQMENSLRVKSANNMRQILLGSIMYANSRKGQFPPDLSAVRKDQDLAPSVFIDPLDPAQQAGYVYVPPPAGWKWDQKDASGLAILYEQFPGGRNVGYADGHIEWLATREDVEKAMKKNRP